MNHTTGPWKTFVKHHLGHKIVFISIPESDRAIRVFCDEQDTRLAPIAERIVACVNACEGIEDPIKAFALARESVKQAFNDKPFLPRSKDESICLIVGHLVHALAALGVEV